MWVALIKITHRITYAYIMTLVATQFQFFPAYCWSLSPNSLRLNASLLPKNLFYHSFQKNKIVLNENELVSVRRVSQREHPLITSGFRVGMGVENDSKKRTL